MLLSGSSFKISQNKFPQEYIYIYMKYIQNMYNKQTSTTHIHINDIVLR